jgi:hypothetical protein
MRIPWLTTVFAALMAGLLAASLLAGTALADNLHTYGAMLVDENEIPKPSTPGGMGWAKIMLSDDQRRVCYELATWGTETPMAAHIHHGAPGVAGPILVPLGAPNTQVMASDIPMLRDAAAMEPKGTVPTGNQAVWYSSGCVDPVDRLVLRDIISNPQDYYVNVHTMADPAGAARGQLMFEQ